MRIDLLGGFRVQVGGRTVSAEEWPARRAAELVQLLALAEGRQATREQAIEALWPHLGADAGGANLRKAAHHARQVLGRPDALVLRGGQVALLPAVRVETDAARFEAQAEAALARGDAAECAAVAAGYGGDLLPATRYEDWAAAPRERLRALQLELLRRSGQWEQLVELDPTDEPAHRELMRRELAAGRRPAAIRWYGRLRAALRRELGLSPTEETQALYDKCVEGLGRREVPLVGRQFELATITASLRSAASGHVSAVVLRGPAGMGKTTLCREIERMAPEEGWTVLATEATAAGAPYAPLADLAERVRGRDASLDRSLGETARSVLARLASPGDEGEALTRHRVIGAVRRLLDAAGGGKPIVLIVDDAHLADEATVDALGQLAGSRPAPTTLLLSFRPVSAETSLSRTVARLGRAGRAVELDLGPLDRADAAVLAVSGATTPRSRETLERIIELGQGNPFLTLELARSAVVGVPALVPTVVEAIASRLLDLDERTLEVLRTLALAADDLDPAAVTAFTGEDEAVVFPALDDALRHRVLVVDGAHYRFAHDLVRQALVEQLPPHRRAAVHRAIAARLEEAGAAPNLVARHWLDGGRPQQAVSWQVAAAGEAMRLGAYADALEHLAPLLARDPEHGEALRLKAAALDARGDQGAPAAYLAAARALGGAEARDLRAMGALSTIKLGDPEGALRALEGVEPVSLEGRIAKALTLAGAAALGYGRAEIGTAQAAEARRLAFASGDPSAVAVASWAQAAAAHARGELRDSVCADLRETHALPQLAVSAFDGQLCITQRLLYGARPYDDVIAFADSLEAEAARLGAARGRAFAVTMRGEAKLLAGRLEEADADLDAGARLHRELDAATGEAFALQRRAEVALYRGDHARANGLLDEALAIARESDVGFHLFDRIYGAKIAAAAEPADALVALEEAEHAVRGPIETCPGCRITLAVPAAIAAARAGDLDRAQAWASATEWLAGVVMRLPAWDAALAEVRGHIARAAGDEAVALEHFRDAAQGFAAAGQPLDEARCADLAGLPRT